MEMKELIITSDLAHFKNGINGKNQDTFKVPPISTVIGIIKNIYGDDICNFIFGYTFEYDAVFKDVTTIYKEINPNTKKLNHTDRFTSDICFIEYLTNPILKIYTNLDNEFKITEQLNLGKTNCLAKCSIATKCNIINKSNIGYNQWTDISTGNGIISRINKETIYNTDKGYYDYFTDLFRLNEEFIAKYTLESTEEGLYLWKYEGVGDVNCYLENI